MRGVFSHLKSFVSFEKAFLFDIDGVLLNASSPVEGAKESIDLLLENEIPFAFLTNGGGVFEKDYLRHTLEDLGYDDSSLLDEIPIVLSHTPMKELVDIYKNENILIVGAKNSYNVACSYGFENAVSVDHVASIIPEIHTHHHDHYRARGEKFPEQENIPLGFDIDDLYDVEFKALLFFYHSIQLDRDLQIMIDLLRSDGRLGTSSPDQVVKLYTSNSDFVYGSKFPLPRFGQGYQHDCLRAGYERVMGWERKLEIEKEYGKPERIQFEFAVDLLKKKVRTDMDEDVEFQEIIMIGDSPFSDIKGSNELGYTSCLVETGIYSEGMKLDEDCTPDFIFENVGEAVKSFL